jgi:hypothetical protein
MTKRAIGYILFLTGAFVIILWGMLGMTGNVISENPVSAKAIDLVGFAIILVSIFFVVSKDKKKSKS